MLCRVATRTFVGAVFLNSVPSKNSIQSLKIKEERDLKQLYDGLRANLPAIRLCSKIDKDFKISTPVINKLFFAHFTRRGTLKFSFISQAGKSFKVSPVLLLAWPKYLKPLFYLLLAFGSRKVLIQTQFIRQNSDKNS